MTQQTSLKELEGRIKIEKQFKDGEY